MTSILYLQRESQPSIGQKREIRRARRRWALIKMTRIPVVSLTGRNCGSWSQLRFSGQKANIYHYEISLWVFRKGIVKGK